MDYVELIPSEDLLYGRRRGYVKVIIAPSPSDAVVTLIAEGFNQTGNFIYVPVGTEVTYTVMRNGYFVSSGTTIADITKVVRVTLQEKPRNIWYAWDSGEAEEWSSPLQVGSTWFGVAYGNGKFVAVGDVGNITTSIDGIAWTQAIQVDINYNTWRSVAYGNGKFVAVGTGGYTASSTDGISWTVMRVGIDSWYDVTYGNGKFVVVGLGFTSTSEDGEEWEELEQIEIGTLNGVVYGNDKFVAVGYNGENGYILTSEDGKEWSVPIITGSFSWQKVAYGNNEFVTISNNGFLSASEDGEEWSNPLRSYDSCRWINVTYGNGKFVLVGEQGYISTFINDEEWSTPVQVGTSNWAGLTYGSGKFVTVGNYGNISYCQIQSVRTQVEFPVIGDSAFDRGQERLGDIINVYDRYAWVYQRGNNVYTAYSSTISPAVGTKLMSDVDGDTDFIIDGSTTNLTVSETGYKKLKIAEFSDFSELDRFPYKDTTTSIKFPSKDLNNWSGWAGLDIPSSSGGTAGSKSVAYGGGKYVIVNSYTFSYSLDGENWVTEASLPPIPSGSYVSVDYLYGNRFIAISDTGYVTIGIFNASGVLSWSSPTPFLGNKSWVSVACNRDQNKLVALGEGGYLSLGTFDLNGNITWSTESSARLGSHNWQVIAYGNGNFVALGQAGYVSVGSYNSSSDAWTWSNPTINSTLSSAEMSYVGLTYGNNKFVTAFSGYSYTNGIKISTSLDGATWTALSSPSSLYGSTSGNIIYDDSKFMITNSYGSANYSVKVFSRNTSEDEEYLYTNFYLSADLLNSSTVTITFENENNVVTFPNPIDIDWGDGTTERINNIATITHTYSSEFSGAQIKITSSSGDLPAIIGSTNVASCDSVLLPFVGPDGQTPVTKCKLFTSDFRNVCSSPFKQSSFSSLYSVFSNSQIKSIALRDMQEMSSNRTKGIARNSSITNADFSKTLLIDNSGLEEGFIRTSISNADFSNLLTAGEKAFSTAFTSYYNNSSIVFPLLESAGKQAFWIAFNGNSHLTDVKFPSLKSAGDSTFKHTFYGDTALTSVDFSSLESISGNETFSEAFYNTSLSSISFPSLKALSGNNIFERAFSSASSLTSISFPVLENASPYAFYSCGSLSSTFNSINFKRLKEAEDHSFIIAFDRCGIQKADFGRLEKAATSAFDTTFNDCPLTEIDLISLRELTGDYVFNGAFSNTPIRDIYLPSLKSIDSESAYVLHGILDGTTNCVLHLPQDLLVNPNTNFNGYGASNPTVLFDLFLRPDLEANGTLGDTTSPFAVSSPTITDVYKAFNSDYETYITKTTDNTEYVTMYSSVPINLIKLHGFTDFSDEVGVVSVQGSNDNSTWTTITVSGTLLDGLNLDNLAYFNYYKVGLSGSAGVKLNEIKLVAIEDAEIPLNVIEPLINEVLEIDYITGDYTDYSYEQAVADIDDILEI